MKTFLILLGRILLRLRYAIEVRGLGAVASRGVRGVLFLPNHPSLLDPVIVNTELFGRFQPRALADKDRVEGFLVGPLARLFRAIPMRDVGAYGAAARGDVDQAMALCAQVLREGGNLVLYPSGHLQSRQFEELGGNSAVSKLLEQAPGTRVVMVRTRGLWGSRFSRAGGRQPDLLAGLGKGVLECLASLVFFLRRRPVVLEFQEAMDFPRGGDRLAQNQVLETFFNAEAPPAQYVPAGWWERGGPRTIPEPVREARTLGLEAIDEGIRVAVWGQLEAMTGATVPGPEARLARDLGMDSLGRLELAAWLEQEYHAQLPNPEALESVMDVLRVAAGLGLPECTTLQAVAPAFFQDGSHPPAIPPGRHLLEVFLVRARLEPHKVILADQIAGTRTYREVLTAICVLRPALARLEGPYVGIMLPASVGATLVTLAVLAAGKVPVMVNWTVGVRSLQHGVDLLQVGTILTAQALLKRLDAQGVDLGRVRERLLPLEEVRTRIGTWTKLRGALEARFGAPSLGNQVLPEEAVVLFTSGSESLPKAVPLTHANLLANLRDILEAYPFQASDRMLGCLPPFHSFGLTGTLLLPLLSGIPVAYHANPTEGPMLARLVEAYRVSMFLGTPTFLAGVVRAATTPQLASLRMVIVGAEKCPDALFDLVGRRWPRVRVLEGYGITECSPVVSGCRLESPKRGSIGHPLSSLELRIVHPETLEPLARGMAGLLLVRGPSVFPGYLHHTGASPFEVLEGIPWYRTGDLVRQEEDGSLTFVGRLKRFVKLGGEMISLPAIEEVLVSAFGHPEDEGPQLAVEATPVDHNPELVLFTVRDLARETVNAALRAAGLSALHHIKKVRRVEAIPLLGTGKTDYRALRALLGSEGL